MFKLLFFHPRVTPEIKKKNSLPGANSIDALLFSHFRVTHVKLINKKKSLNSTVTASFSYVSSVFSLLYCGYIYLFEYAGF